MNEFKSPTEILTIANQLQPFDSAAWESVVPTEFLEHFAVSDPAFFEIISAVVTRSGSEDLLCIAMRSIVQFLDEDLTPAQLEEVTALASSIMQLPRLKYFKAIQEALLVEDKVALVKVLNDIDLREPTIQQVDRLIAVLPDDQFLLWHRYFADNFMRVSATREGVPSLVEIARKSGSQWQVRDALLLLSGMVDASTPEAVWANISVMLDSVVCRWIRTERAKPEMVAELQGAAASLNSNLQRNFLEKLS